MKHGQDECIDPMCTEDKSKDITHSENAHVELMSAVNAGNGPTTAANAGAVLMHKVDEAGEHTPAGNAPLELASMELSDVSRLLAAWGEPKFRAKQVLAWLASGTRPDEMFNVPKALRERLNGIPFGGAVIIERLFSAKDDTVKLLYELSDGNIVEGVLMRYSYGSTLCISTQAGCRMGCAFCASTLNGRVRNLTAGEMLSEVTSVEKMFPCMDEKKRTVTNIVMMGSGEPLDNYENTLRFLNRATDPDGLGISTRNISLSTCGLVPQIYQFTEEAPHVTLCISLHAPNNEIRDKLMPVNRRYRMEELIAAANHYEVTTGRRVIFEYALVSGVNDSRQCAMELAERLRGINCHVNLIPLNSVKERNLNGVDRKYAHIFASWLEKMHISATVRRELGTDIEGACGQLRNKYSARYARGSDEEGMAQRCTDADRKMDGFERDDANTGVTAEGLAKIGGECGVYGERSHSGATDLQELNS